MVALGFAARPCLVHRQEHDESDHDRWMEQWSAARRHTIPFYSSLEPWVQDAFVGKRVAIRIRLSLCLAYCGKFVHEYESGVVL